MNISLISIFALLIGGFLVPLLMFFPLLIKAPKNQVTIIFCAFTLVGLLAALGALFKLFSPDSVSQFEEKEIFFELLIYAIFCLTPLFIRATRTPITKGSLMVAFFIYAATSFILCIPLISEKLYLSLVTGLTPFYVSIDPVRALIPMGWSFYEVSKKIRSDPSFIMKLIQSTVALFIVLSIFWLIYLELNFVDHKLITQLQNIGPKNYGPLFPIKFLHLGLLTFLVVAIDSYWVLNYTMAALEEQANQARISKLLFEKDQLIQDLSNKNALVETGALSAGLAHELNQFLARIQLNSDEALAQISRPGADLEDLRPYLMNTLIANQSAANLIISLKKLFQSGKLESSFIDLDALVLEVASLYEDRAKKSKIKIELNLHAKKSFDVWDSLMRQAIANLVANAIDALDAVDREDKLIQIGSALDECGYYLLEITDNGLGIDPMQAERLFSLFATNKPSGTGIGLWLSSYIVQRHQGSLDFKNLPNHQGVSFFISIPSSELSAA